MPAVTFYRHGLTASIMSKGNPDPPKRGKVVGWSPAAARRNVKFLRSVDERELTGTGWAVTLTVKKCPSTPASWSAALHQWQKRVVRAGVIRFHWVMEFQRRGVPHLHAAVWFDTDITLSVDQQRESLLVAWQDVAQAFEAGSKGQHARPIEGVVGWFQYMAKHCSRSHVHYQRQRDAVPKAWASSPRVWGKGGEWPLCEPAIAEVSSKAFWRLRRLVKASRLAEARRGLPLNRGQVGHLRRILKCNNQKLSSVRPVSEWMPEHRQVKLLKAAAGG